MRHAAALTLAVLALGAAVAAWAADAAHTIVQSGRAFHPADVTINHGEQLDFSNQDDFIHQIYVDSPGFKYDSAEQSPGETFHIAFPNVGTFPIRCHIHPKMLLTVHVK